MTTTAKTFSHTEVRAIVYYLRYEPLWLLFKAFWRCRIWERSLFAELIQDDIRRELAAHRGER